MYSRYDDDDDSDSLVTRGQDLRNKLRHVAHIVSRIEDPAAKEATREMLEALRLITEVLYDLSEPPQRRLIAAPLKNSPHLLS